MRTKNIKRPELASAHHPQTSAVIGAWPLFLTAFGDTGQLSPGLKKPADGDVGAVQVIANPDVEPNDHGHRGRYCQMQYNQKNSLWAVPVGDHSLVAATETV